MIDLISTKEISDVMILFFEMHQRTLCSNYTSVESFDNYTTKRKLIISQMKLPQKYIEKVQNLLVLEYLIEFYVGNALSEKTMNSYYRSFNDFHVKIIETILRDPENLRTIISALTNRNGDFVYFMLECLYVIESNTVLNKAMLDAFNKCNADKYLVRKITLNWFYEDTINGCSLFKNKLNNIHGPISLVPKLNPEKAKLLNLTLQLFILTLNKANPISMVHFFTDFGDQKSAHALTTHLIKLLCQSKFKALSISARHIFDQLLSNLNTVRTQGNFGLKTLACEKLNFLKRVVDICIELNIFKSQTFFKVLNLFVQHQIYDFAIILTGKIDLLQTLQELSQIRSFSANDSCILFSFLNMMFHSGIISEELFPQLCIFISDFKKNHKRKLRVGNMLHSNMLIFEKILKTKFQHFNLFHLDSLFES